MTSEEKWMQSALKLARQAERNGEVPVGAVVIKGDKCIGEGWNQPIGTADPTAHAEIMALRSAAKNLANYRLNDAVLYVTLEPCIMCAGAIIHSRLSKVVFGASDPKGGAAGSVFDILLTNQLNHSVDVRGGIMEEECALLLQNFFQKRR